MQAPNKGGKNCSRSVSKSKIDACIRSKISAENLERQAQYAPQLDNQGQIALSAGSRPNNYGNQGSGLSGRVPTKKVTSSKNIIHKMPHRIRTQEVLYYPLNIL